MKKQIISFLILLSFVFSISAQTNEAQKVDEFGDMDCEDVLAKLGNLAVERSSEPNLTAFIIVYEGKFINSYLNKKGQIFKKYELPMFGEAIARTQSMQLRLARWNYPMNKFYFIDGGFRENFTVEFWIVPKGVTPPKPTPTLEEMKYRKGKTGDFCTSF